MFDVFHSLHLWKLEITLSNAFLVASGRDFTKHRKCCDVIKTNDQKPKNQKSPNRHKIKIHVTNKGISLFLSLGVFITIEESTLITMPNQLLIAVSDSTPRTNGENGDATTYYNHSNDATSHNIATTGTTTPTPTTTAAAVVHQRRHHPIINNIDNRDHHINSNGVSNYQAPTRNKSSTGTARKVHSTENNHHHHFILLPRTLLLNLAAALSSVSSPTATNSTADQQQQQQRQQQKFIRLTTVSIISLCFLYIYVLFRTQHILDKHEAYFHHNQHPHLNTKNQLRRGQQPVLRMIPISPLEMVQHPDAVQQLVQHFRPPGGDDQNNRILRDRISREPRQYLQYLQNQALQTKQASQDSSMSSSSSTNATITDSDLFIIYNANIPGQGVGNLIAGLLAAHLLGDEFDRIVCVNPQFWNSGFLTVFESIDPTARAKCPLVLQQQNPARLNETRMHDLALINYEGAADECHLQNLMLDTNKKVIYMIANTYPRWPVVPNNYFLYYYQPTPTMFDALPYSIQPTTVVHLRQPDDSYDRRNGLDADSLDALGKLLPSNSSTFLVTNNVDFYHRFRNCCHWSHPSWKTVTHTALGVSWGTNASQNTTNELSPPPPPPHVQTWVDWYTILMADDVYHIHSDFSISAIHWMNKKNHSFTINGYDALSQQVVTVPDLVWEDGETIPVRDRTVQGQPGTTNDLRACSFGPGGSRTAVEERERRHNHKMM